MVYIIYDLEATCWKGFPLAEQQEIIEIAAFALPQGELIHEEPFHRFVKPILAPKLSMFCKKLTTIKQHEIDSADYFPEVIDDFLDWLGDFDDELIFCSWGSKDVEFLLQDLRLHQIEEPLIDMYIDMKYAYSRMIDLSHEIGFKAAMKAEDIEFEGQAHRAIWDTKNLIELFMKYRTEWIRYVDSSN